MPPFFTPADAGRPKMAAAVAAPCGFERARGAALGRALGRGLGRALGSGLAFLIAFFFFVLTPETARFTQTAVPDRLARNAGRPFESCGI